MSVWILPTLLILVAAALAVPLAWYISWIMDGKYKVPRWLAWLEGRVNTGPQNWKVYTVSLLLVNALMFVWGFLLLAVQPLMPFSYNLKDNAHEFLAPTTILNTVCSFLTNTNLQDYSGEVHLSCASAKMFMIVWNMCSCPPPVGLSRPPQGCVRGPCAATS